MLLLIIDILLRIIQVYSYLLLVYALLSWFPGAYNSGLGRLITFFTEPIIQPFRRFPLQFAGFDFTIWAVIIALNVLSGLLVRLIGLII
ncbi:YggT family protein [Streptococcus sciuri]|uniref:YggT family protein n=1 Tax=Streptococcus sciuri TaxID=2973939 RepID=A0ABT2F9R4_9STRE|nr:YggT family protein [Streptococcus sciuri]MCS4488565.1 YggT family protein [Streptococcus sciuri]